MHSLLATCIRPHKVPCIRILIICILSLIGVQKIKRNRVKWKTTSRARRQPTERSHDVLQYAMTFLSTGEVQTNSGLFRVVQKISIWSKCCSFQSRDLWQDSLHSWRDSFFYCIKHLILLSSPLDRNAECQFRSPSGPSLGLSSL